MAGEIRIGCDTLCFLFDRGILLIEAVYIVRLGKMVVGIIQISWFFFGDASAHVENLCPEISQILPAGNTPRFAWRELRPQGPRAISVSPWPDRSWGDQWHGWRGAIPPDQRCQRGNPRNGGFIMEKSSMTKKNSLIKLPSLILRGIWVGGPLFWGFWRFGVALQMLILLPKNLSWTSPDPGSSVANGRCTKTLGWRRTAWLEMSLRSRLGRRLASGGWDHISLGSPLMVSLRSFAKGVQTDDMKSMRNSGTSLEFFCG